MANDAASAVSGTGQAVGGTGAERTRIPPIRDTASGTSITAEIPAVPAGPSYGVLLPDGSVWYPGSKKKMPAPPILRVIVWVIAFAVLLVLIADLLLRYEPSWTRTFRHVVSASSLSAGSTRTSGQSGTGHPGGSSGTGAGGNTTPTTGNSAVFPANPQPSGLVAHETEYKVTLPSYAVKVVASAEAWVNGIFMQGGSQVNQQQYTLASPGGPSSETFSVPRGQSFQLEVAHAGVTVQIWYGFKEIATVGNPNEGLEYLLFVPAAG